MHKATDGRRTALSALLLGGLLTLTTAAAQAATTTPYIVIYDQSSPAASRAATADITADENVSPSHRFNSSVKGFSARLTAAQRTRILGDPRVANVVPDRIVKATSLVPLLSGDVLPTGVRRVGSGVDSTVRQASSVNVAVIDTGIDLTHPDLNAVAGTDCTGSGTSADGNGHGTHVAGTIGARNQGSGVVGVAPGTKLFAVRVLGNDGSGYTSQVVCGIDWVTATRTDANASNDIAVANMSLGSSGPAGDGDCGRAVGDAMHLAICRSVAAGVTYVVAAGNSGADEQGFVPANYPEVITVTAMGDSDGIPGSKGGVLSCLGTVDDAQTSFSNYATRASDIAHTIAAPGGCIRSTYKGGAYATMSGTSMASPHVAGLVALCFGENGGSGPCTGKSPADVRTLLLNGAKAASAAAPANGFAGDPTRPVLGRYYGHLAATRFEAAGATPAPVTAPANTTAPVVSGTATVGSTLTTTSGTWSGTGPIGTVIAWTRCTGDATSTCTVISGATATTYTPSSADAGLRIRSRVTATNTAGSAQAFSAATAAIAAPAVAPANTAVPVVSGTAAVGATLTATEGTWTGTAPLQLARQWVRCSGTACSDIAGATAATYVLTATDAGKQLKVRVTATNSKGSASAQSALTAVVASPGVKPALTASPVITGTAKVGQTLSVSTGTWTGSGPITYTYDWALCAPGSNVCYYNGARGSTYTVPTTTAVGSRLVVVVTATNAFGVAYGQSAPTAPLAGLR